MAKISISNDLVDLEKIKLGTFMHSELYSNNRVIDIRLTKTDMQVSGLTTNFKLINNPVTSDLRLLNREPLPDVELKYSIFTATGEMVSSSTIQVNQWVPMKN
ncbi:MAG: hypothetical protein IPO92_00445 [Saprospiraceae bacterium]|nr:hypothetical protein [Saprospiraceae bacterium]